MKKYIFSVLMAAMAAFTFSSCEDVPEPYTQPTKPDAGGTTDPNQKGSESNPYTVAEAIALIKAGTAPSTAVCVKGKITAVTFFNETYSSLSYNIADEGSSDVIEVYSGKGKDGANFSSKDDLKVGQTVVVKGIVKAFTKNDGTIVNEIDKNSTIISIENTGTTTPDTPATGKGSLSDPYNVAEAIAVIKAGTAPTTQVYLTGIISDVAFYNETYKSITYYISDDGKSKDMQVYSGKGLKGADFASKEDLKVGQKVTILGKIMKFTDKNGNDIMEVDKTSSIVKIEGEGTGGEVKPDPKPDPTPGEVATGDNGGFENWTDSKPTNWNTNSAGNASLTKSEDAHSGKYSVQVAGTNNANKRLGYKEMSLKAGKYTIKFYAKAATATGAAVCPGHVAVNNGTVDSQNYNYTKQYVNISNTEWTLVEQEITIEKDGTYSIVIMNAKKPGAAVLIDDFTFSLGSTAIIK
jgi:RPA family protein